MTKEEMIRRVQNSMNEARFKHTMGTVKAAVELAEKLGENTEKTYTAALLHDCAKNMPFEEQLEYGKRYGYIPDEITKKSLPILHAPIGALVAEHEYGIQDADVLNAIRYHTTGRENMTVLDEIVFTADLTEENRSYEFVDELRDKVNENFHEGLILAFDRVIGFVLAKGTLLHPTTVFARNWVIEQYKVEEKKQ